MNIKKIVASAGIAAGALAAMATAAQASPLSAPQLPDVNPVGKVTELGESAGISTLHNAGGNVELIHDGTSLLKG